MTTARLIRTRITWGQLLFGLLFSLVATYVILTAIRIQARRYYLFLPDYVRWTFAQAPAPSGPTHIFVLFTDHWEPGADASRAREWADRYKALASRHRDSDGRPPQHTWFYPGEQYAPDVLEILRELTVSGLGEVEMHMHHGRDTEATLRAKLERAIGQFQQYGFLRTVDGQTRFAFIHGNFGLDNANGSHLCGVPTEIKLLRDLGCFADFSFPSVYERAQPDVVNDIYAVKDDPQPKSYEHRLPLSSLADGSADLMMFQGPLVFSPSWSVRRLLLDLDDGNIHAAKPASPARIAHWLRANVHVPERPDWVFIKLWAHGVSSEGDEEEVIGPRFDATLTSLERDYNDGTRYVLHYVTAREAYNLAMAASRGASGAPRDSFNAIVPPYVTARPGFGGRQSTN